MPTVPWSHPVQAVTNCHHSPVRGMGVTGIQVQECEQLGHDLPTHQEQGGGHTGTGASAKCDMTGMRHQSVQLDRWCAHCAGRASVTHDDHTAHSFRSK
jgi:hypothetical protein